MPSKLRGKNIPSQHAWPTPRKLRKNHLISPKKQTNLLLVLEVAGPLSRLNAETERRKKKGNSYFLWYKQCQHSAVIKPRQLSVQFHSWQCGNLQDLWDLIISSHWYVIWCQIIWFLASYGKNTASYGLTERETDNNWVASLCGNWLQKRLNLDCDMRGWDFPTLSTSTTGPFTSQTYTMNTSFSCKRKKAY